MAQGEGSLCRRAVPASCRREQCTTPTAMGMAVRVNGECESVAQRVIVKLGSPSTGVQARESKHKRRLACSTSNGVNETKMPP
mmetsp:Transcript_351/g.929  ORF Transcript_351/g.929 Transcript_351/m.929 type:complete len:83 (+) Transcript_351:479-727(+)